MPLSSDESHKIRGSIAVSTSTSIIALFIAFQPAQLHAAGNTYYVTEDGKGSMTGESPENAWRAGYFNGLSGTGYAGDTIYFSGTFSTRITVRLSGSNGNPVTLDGDEGNCDPLHAVCYSSALLNQGMMVDATLADNEYLIIQDFRMTFTGSGCFQTIGGAFHVGSSYQQEGSNDHIIIRRNSIDDTAAAGLNIGNHWEKSEYLIVEENRLTNFHMRCDIAESSVFILANYGHVVIRNNIFGHDNNPEPNCPTGCNTLTLHAANDLLFEYNDVYGGPQQAGMSAKEDQSGHRRHIWRFNKVHDNAEWGMANSPHNTPPNEYFYVYGNYVYNNGRVGIEQYDDADYGYYWSNIIANNGDQAFNTWERGSGTPDYAYIANNTIARNGHFGPWHTEMSKGGITFTAGSNFTVKNNLLYDNREPGAGSYHQIYDGGQNSAFEHNTLFHSSAPATWYYAGAPRTLATMQSSYGREDDIPAGKVTNPGFVDPDGPDNIHGTADDNYSLNGTNVGDGANLSKCYNQAVDLSGGDNWMEANSGYGRYIEPCLEDALDPDRTDWTTTPPTVATIKRGSPGVQWGRGAYAYLESDTTAPASPTNLRVVP